MLTEGAVAARWVSGLQPRFCWEGALQKHQGQRVTRETTCLSSWRILSPEFSAVHPTQCSAELVLARSALTVPPSDPSLVLNH